MDSFRTFVVIDCFGGSTLLETDTSPYSGKCDGCGASGVPIMKLSLGRDFFGRVYDRLSPNTDLSPKWYCDACSVEKILQRDFRDIEQEFRKAATRGRFGTDPERANATRKASLEGDCGVALRKQP